MGIYWLYECWWDRLLSDADVGAFVSSLKGAGFAEIGPRGVGYAQNAEGEMVDFATSGADLGCLRAGNVVTYWNGAATVTLHVCRDACEAPGGRRMPPGWSTLTASVDGAEFRRETATREDVANSLLSAFAKGASELRAAYAFVGSEDHREIVWDLLDSVVGDVRRGRLPLVAWWWTYYAANRFPVRTLRRLIRSLGLRAVECGTGVAVQMTRYPWEVDPTAFAKLNEGWKVAVHAQKAP